MVRPNREAVVSKLAYMLVYFYASLCKFRNSALWASVKVTDWGNPALEPETSLKTCFNESLRYTCRFHVTLHLDKCGEKAVQCSVSGWHAVFRGKDHEDHVYTAALSHIALQAGEVERLRRILYHNVSISWSISICIYVECTDRLPLFNGERYIKRFLFMNVHMSDFCLCLTQNYDKTPTITRKEGKTSFRWKVEQISLYADTVIASPCFVSPERYRRRGVWENSILYLQPQAAANPVTAKIRLGVVLFTCF